MSVSTLYYARCDECGNPCGTGDELADSAKEARQIAKARGWRFTRSGDYCPRCAAEKAS